MKRLIVTGLPCPASAWEKFLGRDSNQRILPIREVLEHTDSNDLRVLSRYVTEVIREFRPDSILCHDLGVPLTFLSLVRLSKRGFGLTPKVTVFNGAFRNCDIFRASHPFRAQIMGTKRIVREVHGHGGEVDTDLKPYLPRIRALYRQIILFGLVEKMSHLFKLDELLLPKPKFLLRNPIQVIASRNDPYLPFEALEQLATDFPAQRFHEVDYGHFPYSGDPKRILPLIHEFEAR